MIPEILYEDNHIIVVSKPSGMLSQGDISGEDSLLDILKQHVKKKYAKEGEAFIGLVHRLDRPVSGVMVFARTTKAARRLHSEIISGKMEKYYTAIVEKKLAEDGKWHKLENFLRRERDITKAVSKETRDSQKADLYYRTIKSSGGFSQVLIKLGTGRKHQIRAQFSSIGAPVAGDKKYGSGNGIMNSICLHSVLLSFNHPTLKEKMYFYSDIPDEFWKFIPVDSAEIKRSIMELAGSFSIQAFLSK